jgi:hypothetical protein
LRAGELVELASARHLVQHLWKVGRAVHRIGKGLHLHDEFRELDLVQGARAVGQLHAGLERRVALSGMRRFPVLRGLVEAFDGERFAARAPRGRQRGQRRLTRNRGLQRDGRDRIDQRIEAGGFSFGDRQRRLGIEHRVLPLLGLCGLFRHDRDLGLPRRVAARRPGVVAYQEGEHQPAQDGQAQGKTAQAASAIDTADSMWTRSMVFRLMLLIL